MLFIFDALKQTNSRASLFFFGFVFFFAEKKMWKGKNQQTLAKNPKHRFNRDREREKKRNRFFFYFSDTNAIISDKVAFGLVCAWACVHRWFTVIWFRIPFSQSAKQRKQTVDEENKQKNNDGYFFEWTREFFLWTHSDRPLVLSSRIKCVYVSYSWRKPKMILLYGCCGRMDDTNHGQWMIYNVHSFLRRIRPRT